MAFWCDRRMNGAICCDAVFTLFCCRAYLSGRRRACLLATVSLSRPSLGSLQNAEGDSCRRSPRMDRARAAMLRRRAVSISGDDRGSLYDHFDSGGH